MTVLRLVGLAAGTLTALSLYLAPMALAVPNDSIPLPTHGQPCNDVNKLGYDPAVGQIVCVGGSWIRSVEPTGVRNFGTPCAPSEMDVKMASSTDGYLISCPSTEGIWVLFTP